MEYNPPFGVADRYGLLRMAALAEAGGKDPSKLDEALDAVAGIVGRSAGI